MTPWPWIQKGKRVLCLPAESSVVVTDEQIGICLVHVFLLKKKEERIFACNQKESRVRKNAIVSLFRFPLRKNSHFRKKDLRILSLLNAQ